jgi:1,4-dihydroxy-2-naphthoyl-CoA hydrolase
VTTEETARQERPSRVPGYADLHTGLVGRMGIEFLEIGTDRVVGRMPVAGNTQPYGILHGGASCVLAEAVGSVVAAAHAAADGRIAMGIEINATHHRAVSDGHVTGVAVPVHAGRSVVTSEITVTDEADRRVCTARLTCLLRDAFPAAAAGASPDAAAGPAPRASPSASG